MLKRTGYILLTFLLLFGTTGVTITRHYCGTELENIAVFSNPDHCCKGDCPRCHDEKISFRIRDNFESQFRQMEFNGGVKTLLQNHTLPQLLAFSNIPVESNIRNLTRDQSLKPFLATPATTGGASPFLQVFLF